MSQHAMIEAVGLSKHYGSFAAVQDLDFRVQAGEVVAFLGPNGAGKSTTMKMLTGYLKPTSGTVRVAGVDLSEDRIAAASKLGYLPENGPLYPDMTPREFLEFFGSCRGLRGSALEERVQVVAEECMLQSVLDKAISSLSKGYRQRVGMGQVLLHEPEVLILDEPTTGLDPTQIRHVRNNIRKLGETRTILLSTHLFQEVEAVADRVLVINDGRLVFDGEPELFKEQGRGSMEEAFHTLTGAA